MATRSNTFILKRSNVLGKIPALSGLTLGELALNTADAKLYTLYTGGATGATEVRQIGWDSPDNYVTGGTYSSGTLTLNRQNGVVTVTGFTTSDTFVTGFTYGNNNLTINRNQGLPPLPVTINNFTGLTVNGILSATTYYGDGTYLDNIITGVTNLGTGIGLYDSTLNKNIQLNSITGDSLQKITTTLNSNTINVGINEQNLTLWGLVVTGNRLIDGGVYYLSGLTFQTTPLTYIINGSLYNITGSTTIVLNSGDTTYDRIDVIVADISGNTSVVEGTPSANPEKPDTDESEQVELTFVYIPANATSLNLTLIYNENVGPPAEWLFSSNATTSKINPNSTTQVYSGSKSIAVTGVTGTTTYINFSSATQFDTSQYSTLQFAIKNRSANTATNAIRFSFLNSSGTQIGGVVNMNGAGTANYVQYSSSNISSWQLIAIPLWMFGLTNSIVGSLRILFVNSTSTTNQTNIFLDRVELVSGNNIAPPTANSWLNIKGDAVTTISAPTPNATLVISGGTNIGSRVTGTDTVVLDLDNSIVVSSISAATYSNLPIDPDNYVTGGTYSNGTLTLNRQNGSFNITGFSQYFISGSTPTGVILNNGDRWYDTDNGVELVYINDGDSSQWVQPANTPGPPGYSNLMITSGITTSAVTLDINVNYYGVNYNGNVNITLPNPSGHDGYNINIKDEGGYASIYRIRLTPMSGLIDGNTYVDMNLNYMSLHVVARNNNWWII